MPHLTPFHLAPRWKNGIIDAFEAIEEQTAQDQAITALWKWIMPKLAERERVWHDVEEAGDCRVIGR
jgi:hypothetical protein